MRTAIRKTARAPRESLRVHRRLHPAVALLFALALSSPSRALVWPDVAERVERDLGAADAATRLAAARQLASLGPARGPELTLAALGDDDDEVRLAAADAAIRLRAAGATESVVPWLNAPSVRLRREACEVARALPNLRAIAPLARTLGDPDADVRVAAAQALGNQEGADAVAPLLGRLDDPSPAVRMAIVAALARLGDARAVVPLLGKVEDSSPEVRQTVARALGDLDDPRASAALVPALRDQNVDVRREALDALGRLHAGDAVDAIAPFAADRAPTVQWAALEALGRIATPDALRVLVAALGTTDDTSPSLEATPVRDALVAAGAAAIPLLHAALAGSPAPTTAASAAYVLGELRAHGEAATITAAMRRGILPAAPAIHALAGAGTAAEVPVVLEFLTDPSPLVRTQALEATMALLDPHQPDGRAVEPLAAALRDPRPSASERAQIAALLGRTGALRAAPLLAQLVSAHDREIQIAAIDALGAIGPAQADSELLDALGSRDPEMRLHAAVSLASAGGPRARDRLLAALDGGDEIDRPAVLTALGGILGRIPSDEAVAKLTATLELAAGPERDAILEAIGRAPLASAVRALAAATQSTEPLDRSTAAAMLAVHGGETAARHLARSLLADPDPGVRAQAAWSLGALGDAGDAAALETAARGPDADPAVNATAALGRIAARLRTPDLAARVLCPLVTEARADVRANALAGLALASARCAASPAGSIERRMLTTDPRDDVRAAAALAVAQNSSPDDRRALDRCAHTDVSSAVAARCRSHRSAPARSNAVLAYVVPQGASSPRPEAAYVLLMADGLLHAGAADRRGAVFDPVAPEGDVSLIR